ncbi:MAG: hypothetical protein ACRD8O_19395 [Bryobacteraceae bacterium]
MELRYMGFDQKLNTRLYRFDRVCKGEPTIRHIVRADMALFLVHHIGIQEGPTLCAKKLSADLDDRRERDHALTNEDLLAYTSARAAVEARRAALRRIGSRRRTSALTRAASS